MILFVIYAVIVWFAAARWRRTPASFAAVGAGVAGLLVVAAFHIMLNRWTGGRIYLPVLQAMLYPYIVLVASIGLYLCCLRRIIPAANCQACEYDLRGLAGERVVCPECGHEAAASPRPLPATVMAAADPGPAPSAARRRVSRARLARGRRSRASAPEARRSHPSAPARASRGRSGG